MAVKSTQLIIKDMQCSGCEQVIEDAVLALPGIQAIHVSYARGIADIEFDDEMIREQGIVQCITNRGYQVSPKPSPKVPEKSHWVMRILVFSGLLLVVGGVAWWGKSLMPGVMQQMNAQLSYAMLFSIGFLTGFHCIGMCGSFVVGYSDPFVSTANSIRSHLAYGLGKTASYSVIGAGFGLLGAAITITPQMRGAAALAASLFLLLYGLKMLNVIPGLRHFTLRLPKAMTRKVNNNLKTQHSPLMIGVLSGLLLGCGPLQAMYIMAAGTGSPQEGALLLFFFGLGTLLPLLGYGVIANFLSRHTIHELVRVSGVLVIVMGVMMANRGLKLTHFDFEIASVWAQIRQLVSTSHLDGSM